MRYLITQSLLNSWLYMQSSFDRYADPDAAEDKAKADFMASLRREDIETTPAMQKGLDFEDLVLAIVNRRPGQEIYDPSNGKWWPAAYEMAQELKGAQFQVKVHRPVTIAGVDLLLYGRLDALKAGTIYDIKFTGNYTVGKFFDSPQHPMYMDIVPEAKRFTYIVSSDKVECPVWRETYPREACPPISATITDFFDYLRERELMPLYEKHWVAKSQ